MFTRPIKAAHIIKNPSWEQLRSWAASEETTTTSGSARYITRIRSRSAKFTDILFGAPDAEQRRWLEEAQATLGTMRLIQLDRVMGDNPKFKLHCRFFIPQEHARLAFMWGQSLFDAPPDYADRERADLTTVMICNWRDKVMERRVLVDPTTFTTYVLGSDYMGEVKKSFLRMAMYWAKLNGGLGLHAGSKLIRVHNVSGELEERGAIFFGLSGTGKTTLTCHHHFLEGDEGVAIRQDDVVMMQADASCLGAEDNFFIKTEGLEPVGQPLLYSAASARKAMLENVWVDPNGVPDFLNYALGRNGRAIVFRHDMDYTDTSIDLPRADLVVFITRREDIVPAVARLTPEQGAAFFMLGESIETAAGDPAREGQPVHSVGTNPFIIGSYDEEGNLFLRLLLQNPGVRVFLLNTGRIGGRDAERKLRLGPDGEKLGAKITVLDSTEIIKQIARGSITWEVDPDWGYEIATAVAGIPDYVERLNPRHYYTPAEYEALTHLLRQDRAGWLAKFSALDPVIPRSLGLRL
ncbi:MAG: phosphoenolpyruvate carboxykinase [Anaerolineae bacterium]|nr:phosphoenolpyruvate carboxykinase [Anaerolineae bacterium]